MIVQVINIPEYRWKVRVYYSVTCYWTDRIMEDFRRLGMSEEDQKKAYANMASCELDNGITYSSPDLRRTTMVIAKASSARELFNSFVHELKHFEEQFGEACQIDQKSEEAAYLRGDVAGEMFDCMAPMLCECCRKKMQEHSHQ